MECELNGRLIKLEEDGELYWWNTHTRGFKIINPKWIKFKQSIVKTRNKKYFSITIMGLSNQTEYKQTILRDKNGKEYKKIGAGRQFLVHRVIYYIHNQEWDIWDCSKSNLIDHIDRNTFNNNIENLRPATQQQNMWNTKSKCYKLTKWNTYRAKVSCGEIMLNKHYKTEQEAIDVVAEFKLKYHQF